MKKIVSKINAKYNQLLTKFILQPFADIIIFYLANAKTDYEFSVGYNMGLVLDVYASYKGIELK